MWREIGRKEDGMAPEDDGYNPDKRVQNRRIFESWERPPEGKSTHDGTKG